MNTFSVLLLKFCVSFEAKLFFVVLSFKYIQAVLFLLKFSVNKRLILLISDLMMQPHLSNCQRALCGILFLAIV